MGFTPQERFGDKFLDDIIGWIVNEYNIDDLFTEREIEDWLEDHAEDYGYIKESE